MSGPTEKPILKALRGSAVEPRPIWLMRQAGRYLPEYRELRAKAADFMTLCLTPKLAAEVTLQPIRRFGFDAAILFADILLVPHALGQRVWFEEGEGPKLAPFDRDLLNRLSPDAVVNTLSPVAETLRLVKRDLPPSTTLIGFAGAPWTVATYMIAGGSSDDSEPARVLARRKPHEFAHLLDILIEATSNYLTAQVEAGAEVLQLFESWAGTVPVESISAFSVEPLKRIIANVRRKAPAVPVIVFPRNAGGNYALYAQIGADAVSLDSHVSIPWVRKQLAPGMVLQGNLDPLALVAGGDALAAGIERILNDTRGTPHIFNLGHGIRPETPIAHVEHLVRLVKGGR